MEHYSRQRILAIVAHPDDETIFFGGTILTHPSCVWKVLCATYTDSSARALEALQAIQCYRDNGINIEIEFLGHEDKHKTPDGGIDVATLDSQLCAFQNWPDVVITHNEKGDYSNNAHISVSRIVRSIFPNAWEILCDDRDLFPVVKRDITWEIKLPLAIQERKREIFLTCYPSQQLLWTRTTYLVEWAFSRSSERFGRIEI